MVVADVLSEQQVKILLNCWEKKAEFNFDSSESAQIKNIIDTLLAKLDSGELRIASKLENSWQVDELAKIAVLLSFRFNKNKLISNAPDGFWYDKVPSKFEGWQEADFKASNIRAVPGSFVRRGSYIGENVILMPSFVNIGAYVGAGTLVDTWATIGSCAQVGKNCHISGGTGIAGVLEPLQASPVIIEDNCFIGARSEIAEGVIVGEGSVISMGVFIGASTKIIERDTGIIHKGYVPPYSVVVPGSVLGKKLANGENAPSLYAAVIIKKVDAQTRSKVGANEILRLAVE